MNSTTRDPLAAFGDRLEECRWVAWRYELRDGEARKIPVSPATGRNASASDPSTWGTCEDARYCCDERGLAGVGYVLGNGLGGVDLDACRNPETGELAPWAREVIDDFATYAEVSPSGTGVKLFAGGAPSSLPAHVIRMDGPAIGGKAPQIEVYTERRYFCVTGDLLPNAPDEIRDGGELGGAWDRLVRRLLPLIGKGGAGDSAAPLVSDAIPRGLRNQTLTSLAGTMRRRGMQEPEILAGIAEINRRRCEPPLPEDEVRRIAASVGRYQATPSAPTAAPEPFPEHPRLPGPAEPERLPLDVLPPTLAGHFESVAQALQVPHELPELLALACVSAAVAGRVEVEPRAGWREPVGIYAACILPPAARKSPTYAAMTAPVRDFEAENIKATAPRYFAALDVVDVAQADLDATKKAAAKGKATRSEVEAARLRLSDAEAAVPPDGRLLAGDVTPEALVQRLAAQGGRVAVLEPEPGPLQMVAGRYSDTARLGELNKAWSSEDLTVDRIGRPPLHVRRPALTLAVLLQPDVLEALPNGKALRAEGLVGRVLWCRPPHGLGTRRTGADVPPLDDTARARYTRALRVLLEMEPAGKEPDGTPIPHVLRLDPKALAVLHAFEAEVERDLGDGGRYASIRDWAGKMVGQSLRLAALLELAARAGNGRPLVADVGPWAMRGAVRLVGGLASHALAILNGLDADPRTEALQYLLRRLQELPAGVTETELRDSARRHRYIDDAEDVADLLDDLEERGCVRRVAQPRKPGAGRDPSPKLRLHPRLVCRTPGERPEYPKNPVQEPEKGDSRDRRDTILGADNRTPDPTTDLLAEPVA